ncbi:MAG: hypothetical protein A2010_14470 [Nitrospirae bacterium GWD2_57_9]|nr:MAG: hypothetical protein A2010_14470 [Nitrospirae bacterium GWD2_57_9]OGW49162.1 MAG: hypothetical protein A2078_04315 [Nitrospirae bacterium GWC2_57_9]
MPNSRGTVERSALATTLFAFVLLFASPAAAAEEPLLFLSDIELKRIEGAPEGRFEIRLYHRDNGLLASYLGTERSYAISENKEYVAITSDRYSFPRRTSGVPGKPSFINDYNLEAFQRIRKEVIAAYGAKPGDKDLVEFVNRYIEKKNYTRGFDVASRVVERREGDCTEHAVLLVSLMRMFTIPAKLVMGIKMIRVGEGYGAFGHAWVEYLQKGKWKAADPTLAMEVDRSYVPVGALENEEMDFTLDLASLLQKMPYRVEAAGL